MAAEFPGNTEWTRRDAQTIAAEKLPVGLLEAEKVAIVPGSAFGENGKGFCRACFATSYEHLIEAAKRMERHVQNLAVKR